MKARTLLQGAGVAALVLFVFYRDLIEMPSEVRMHTPVSATNLAVALIANLILISLFFLLVGTWLRRTSRWTGLRLLVPGLVLATTADVIYVASQAWESTHLWVYTFLTVLIMTSLAHWLWPRGERWLFRLSGAVLFGLGIFCIFVMFQLFRLAVWHQTPNRIVEKHNAIGRANRTRIVWILFDELSYRQVFGNRYLNLQLPNFNELRESSTLFTDTQPIVNFTEDAIPAIFLGERVERVNYTTQNKLQVGTWKGRLHPFDAANTPFAFAQKYGLTTGVVGWTNPYCGILSPFLNQCYWIYEFREPASSAAKDFWIDSSYPWIRYSEIFLHPRRLLSKKYRGHVVEDLMDPGPGKFIVKRVFVYQDLMRHSEDILGPSGPDFVFIHLSVPHPPNFYNRGTRQFETSHFHSYIDGLALADKSLGQLLQILKKSPRWGQTSVIVSGDHSWRVYLWSPTTYWTPEDEAASHGRVFDPRPVLMVHLAGQTTPETVTTPFPLLRVHNILDDLIEGRQPAYASLQKAESLAGQ